MRTGTARLACTPTTDPSVSNALDVVSSEGVVFCTSPSSMDVLGSTGRSRSPDNDKVKEMMPAMTSPDKCENGIGTLVETSTSSSSTLAVDADEPPSGPPPDPASTSNNVEELGVGKRRRKARQDDFAYVRDDSTTAGSQSPRKRPRKTKTTEEEFATVWICCECKEAECLMQPEADQLLICDGPCRRVFHYPCVGLLALPPEDVDYVCPDCTNRSHRCAICQDYGADADLILCSKHNCGLSFHPACLAMQNVDVPNQDKDDEDINIETASDDKQQNGKSDKVRFVCPAHECWTCTQMDLRQQEQADLKLMQASKGKKKGKAKGTSSAFDAKTDRYLIRCMECPTSYHVTCIPPTARFHELALLCHTDAERHKLPNLDPEGSIQSRIEQKASSRFDVFLTKRQQRARSASSGKNPFFPGLLGDALTKREQQLVEALEKNAEGAHDDQVAAWDEGFCLPCDVQKEVYAVPPQYKHVTALQYDATDRPTKAASTGEKCQCVGFCGDDCLNRMLYTECFGDKGSTNCRVGLQCGNRTIAQRRVAKCRPQREHGKGWGLVGVNKIFRGDLVQEYVGEVVREKEKERRLSEWESDRPNDHNFYMMSLCQGWYIDARLQGNLSRFINHSCDPNCVLLQINVGGNARCGIFAKRDIEAGEFLSYDYHFDTRQGDRFVCRCGAKRCRGTMQGGKGDGSPAAVVTKSKAELWEAAKARYERDKKSLAEHYESESARLNQVSHLVPEAENANELVANGPPFKYRGEAIRGRVFLWRNAVKGSDFASRLARLERKRRQRAGTAPPES